MSHQLTEDVVLTDSASDELRRLATEIEHQNLLVNSRSNGSRGAFRRSRIRGHECLFPIQDQAVEKPDVMNGLSKRVLSGATR